jgi:5-methylcytosine-specific restriction enzyme subunit McrC
VSIPVQNIYYLLSYAWRDYSAGDVVDVDSVEQTELINLFAKVLLEGTRHLLRRGLSRDYRTYSRELAGVRGQIDFGRSLNKMLFQQGRAECRVDELTPDNLKNRLLKSTLQSLLAVGALDDDLREQIHGLLPRFHQVQALPRLNPLQFSRVQLQRNDRYYRLLLNICEVIARNLLINEETGEARFRDVLREDVDMPMLFERFVRHFYRREKSGLTSRAEWISWHASAENDEAQRLLPKMKTDVTLRWDDRVLIIDTKYYQQALAEGQHRSTIHSGNLYQIYAYVKNYGAAKDFDGTVEGMLLYPVVGDELRLEYEMGGHRVRVCTVDLAQDWRAVHEELIGLV